MNKEELRALAVVGLTVACTALIVTTGGAQGIGWYIVGLVILF